VLSPVLSDVDASPSPIVSPPESAPLGAPAHADNCTHTATFIPRTASDYDAVSRPTSLPRPEDCSARFVGRTPLAQRSDAERPVASGLADGGSEAGCQ
jgi:hypothetical protein